MVATTTGIWFWNNLQAKERACCVRLPIHIRDPGGGTHDDVVEDLGMGFYTIREDWASPLQHYLETCTFPKTLDRDQWRRLAIKVLPYSLVGGNIHKLCGDGIIHTCVSFAEAHKFL
jgi:hypothetical protein